MLLLLLACTDGAGNTLPASVLTAAGETPCSIDADCVISRNSCYPDATCSHADDLPALPDILCDPPDYGPPSTTCVCEDLCSVR